MTHIALAGGHHPAICLFGRALENRLVQRIALFRLHESVRKANDLKTAAIAYEPDLQLTPVGPVRRHLAHARVARYAIDGQIRRLILARLYEDNHWLRPGRLGLSFTFKQYEELKNCCGKLAHAATERVVETWTQSSHTSRATQTRALVAC